MIGASIILVGCGAAKTESVDDAAKQIEEPKASESIAEVEEKEVEENEAEEKEAEPEQEAAYSSEQNDNRDAIATEAASAYAEYIKSNEEIFEPTFGAVGLIHVDDDEIPELAFSNGTAHFNSVLVFSYDGSNVTELGNYGSFGCACYEYRAGTIYGYYSGQGSTFDDVGIVDGGKLINVYSTVINDLEAIGSDTAEKSYTFVLRDAEHNENEITQEEYENIINPFLIENRDYTLIANENLLPLYGMDNIEESLLKSLDMEGDYPKVAANYQESEYFSSRITPES